MKEVAEESEKGTCTGAFFFTEHKENSYMCPIVDIIQLKVSA